MNHDPLSPTRRVSIERHQGERLTVCHDSVVEESQFVLEIDGLPSLTIALTPTDLEDFVIGFLWTSGGIRRLDEVAEVSITGLTARVRLTRPPAVEAVLPISAAVPCWHAVLEVPAVKTVPLPDDWNALCRHFTEFAGRGTLFAETGGTHAAAVSDGQELLSYVEDIGRATAIDKAVGRALRQGIPLAGRLLLSTGRISGEIVRKAAISGLSAILSPSAPTALAIDRAACWGLTLVGFLRGDRGNVYPPPAHGR